MASFNKVILMGNLTRDPALKFLPSQTPVAEFGIATNRKYKTANGEDKEDVCFVDCTAFGKQAEVISQYCTKGRALLVEGRLKFDQWEGQDGSKRSKLTVVVEGFQFAGDRGPQEGGEDRQDAAPRRQQNHRGPLDARPGAAMSIGKPQRAGPVAAPFGDKSEFEEADIPF